MPGPFVADDLWTVKRLDREEDVFLAWGDSVEDAGRPRMANIARFISSTTTARAWPAS
jgi:hypothetical protein